MDLGGDAKLLHYQVETQRPGGDGKKLFSQVYIVNLKGSVNWLSSTNYGTDCIIQNSVLWVIVVFQEL